MDIILKEDVKGLGYKNDTVNVKAGYGRNYLIPKGGAILASKSNRKMIDENIRQAAHKAEKSLKDAQAIADKIGETPFEMCFIIRLLVKTAGNSDCCYFSISVVWHKSKICGNLTIEDIWYPVAPLKATLENWLEMYICFCCSFFHFLFVIL